LACAWATRAYGGTVGYAKSLMHGKPSRITQVGSSPLFAGLPREFQGARYHSLAAVEDTLRLPVLRKDFTIDP